MPYPLQPSGILNLIMCFLIKNGSTVVSVGFALGYCAKSADMSLVLN